MLSVKVPMNDPLKPSRLITFPTSKSRCNVQKFVDIQNGRNKNSVQKLTVPRILDYFNQGRENKKRPSRKKLFTFLRRIDQWWLVKYSKTWREHTITYTSSSHYYFQPCSWILFCGSAYEYPLFGQGPEWKTRYFVDTACRGCPQTLRNHPDTISSPLKKKIRGRTWSRFDETLNSAARQT